MTPRADTDLQPQPIPWAAGHSAPAANNRPAIERRPTDDGRTADQGMPGIHPSRRSGGGLLAVASCLLLLLAAAQGYVSFRAQYVFIDRAKQAHVPSMLEALGLDTGAVIFALLALSLARRGRRGTVERVLNGACALGSLTMNLLAADLNSPRSVTVWVLPSALYALASDRLIAVVRRWAQASDPDAEIAEGSAWRACGGVAFWVLRLIVDAPGTVAGFRRWVLAVAPVAPGLCAGPPPDVGQRALPADEPDATAGERKDNDAERWPGELTAHHEPRGQAEPRSPDTPSRDELASGETKRQALIRLYEHCGQTGDPRYANPAKTAELARWRIRLFLRPGAGYANIGELAVRWSRLRAVRTGRRSRPSLPWWARLLLPVTAYAVRLGRAHLGRRVIASMEDQTLVLAAPRTGKSGWLADRIIDHPGAVVTTTTRTDLFENTAPLRVQRGVLHVFNPEGIGGLPSTFR